jgi:ElaB/YqjD/DUF883 family membrane-anchored ribosome-binding protein
MMNEEQQVPSTENEPAGSQSDSARHDAGWQEVGRQFQVLGESLAQAMRTAWENEETQRRVQEMRTGLESMVQDVNKAIEDSASSPQAQKVREEAGRTVESLRSAGEKTAQEVRPQLIEALQQLNNELQKFVNRMERPAAPPPGDAPTNEDNDPGINI